MDQWCGGFEAVDNLVNEFRRTGNFYSVRPLHGEKIFPFQVSEKTPEIFIKAGKIIGQVKALTLIL